jgi:hypothetical protein
MLFLSLQQRSEDKIQTRISDRDPDPYRRFGIYSKLYNRQADNFKISEEEYTLPKIGLEHKVGVCLVLILKIPGRLVSHSLLLLTCFHFLKKISFAAFMKTAV